MVAEEGGSLLDKRGWHLPQHRVRSVCLRCSHEELRYIFLGVGSWNRCFEARVWNVELVLDSCSKKRLDVWTGIFSRVFRAQFVAPGENYGMLKLSCLTFVASLGSSHGFLLAAVSAL